MGHKLSNIRREYGGRELRRSQLDPNPVEQFKQWHSQMMKDQMADPTVMVLSTVDQQGIPDNRVVLLKEIIKGCFIFYTNYQSKKAQQLTDCHYAALNFYWPIVARQVRIRGRVSRTSTQASDDYFKSRPRTSQISALASPQSQVIPDRQFLDERFKQLNKEYADADEISQGQAWGGYAVKPFEFEFWQGRDNRLHDRFHYFIDNNDKWIIERLAP